MLQGALSWTLAIALGVALLFLLAPFAETLVLAVYWAFDGAPGIVLVGIVFIALPFALAPFVIVALIFRGTWRSLWRRG